MASPKQSGPGASVDYLVDENASVVDVPDDSLLVESDDIEKSVGATAPAAWWRLGLIALGIVAAILLLMQLLGGNPGTGVVPGTPVSAPTETSPAVGY